MKSIEKQIEFIDKKLLPLYNIKNIVDHSTVIYEDELSKNKNLLINLNKLMDEFKQLFPVKNFNLHKTNNSISSYEHSFLFLKKILDTSYIYFEVGSIKKRKYLRLIPENKILKTYIKSMEKSSFIRNIDQNNEASEKTKLNNYSYKFQYSDLNDNIKKKYTEEFYLFPQDVLNGETIKLKIWNNQFANKNINNIKLFFVSNVNHEGTEYCSEKILNTLNMAKRYVILGINGKNISYGFNNNYLIDNLFILNKNSGFNEIVITLNNIESEMIHYVLLKIVVTYVDFYSEFDTKLKNSWIEQKINLINDGTILINNNGIMNLRLKPIDANNVLKNIKGQDETVGNLKCYIINDNDMKNTKNIDVLTNSTASLFILSEKPKYDLVYSLNETYNFGDNLIIKNIDLKKKSYENIYRLNCLGDLIYNIKLITKYPIKLENMNLYLKGYNKKGALINYPLIIKNNVHNNEHYEYEITNINKHVVINMMSHTDTEIFMIYEDEIICNYFRNSKILVSYCYAESKLRKQLTQKDLIINLNEYQYYN